MSGGRKSPDVLFRFILGGFIGLGAVYAGIVIFRMPLIVLAVMPSFIPMTHGFLVLETFTIGLLTLGRHRALRDPLSFWVGIAFLTMSVTNGVYVLAWPGILTNGESVLGRLPDTASWIVQSGQVLFATTLIAGCLARWPGENSLHGNSWWRSVLAWMLFAIVFNGAPVALEGYLPSMVDSGGNFTAVMTASAVLTVLLYLTGMLISARNYLRTRDRLAGYIAIDLMLMIYGSLGSLVAAQRYALLWYVARGWAIMGSMILLLGLLLEYVGMYRRERKKANLFADVVAERERAEAAVRALNDELSLRVTAQTAEIVAVNESLEHRIAERTAEIQKANVQLQSSRRAALNLMDDTLRAQKRVMEINTDLQREVDERKRTEEALRQSEERFRAIAESSSVGIGVLNVSDGIFLYVNRAYATAFGYGEDELLGHAAPMIYWDLGDREEILRVLRQAGFVGDYEVRLKRKDGKMFWGMSSVRPIDYGGKAALLGTFVDITRRKEAEEELIRFNRVAVGRENRMIELKKEVNELCLKLGESLRYEMEFEGVKQSSTMGAQAGETG